MKSKRPKFKSLAETLDPVKHANLLRILADRGPFSRLTLRELEVVRVAGEASGAKEIAARLNIRVSTVYRHSLNIYRKLGVHSLAQAVEMGWRRFTGSKG